VTVLRKRNGVLCGRRDRLSMCSTPRCESPTAAICSGFPLGSIGGIMGACPPLPAADRTTPAMNAGTSSTVTCASARSRFAGAIRKVQIHGNGTVVSIPARIRGNARSGTAATCNP
jgi:hypothetical protein